MRLYGTPTTPGLIETFLRIRGEQGVSKCTTHNQGSWLKRWNRSIEGGATLQDFNLPRLRLFVTHLDETRGLAANTLSSCINAFRVFGDWLVEQNYLTSNPAKGLRYPKPDKKERKSATDDEVFAMLDAADRYPSVEKAALVKALLSVFIYAGLRRAEALNLRLDNVDFRARTIYVYKGKGGKSRTIPVHVECLKAVEFYLTLRPESEHDFLFAFNRTYRVGYDGITQIFREVRRLAKMGKESDHLTPHTFRHNYATRLDEAGVGLKTISELLGHEDIATTAKYLHSGLKQKMSAAAAIGRPQPTTPHTPLPPAPPNAQQNGTQPRTRVAVNWQARKRGEG